MKEEYVRTSGTLIRRGNNAILVDFASNQDQPRNEHWIPLSLIHGADEMRINNDHINNTIHFRLMRWKAQKLNV